MTPRFIDLTDSETKTVFLFNPAHIVAVLPAVGGGSRVVYKEPSEGVVSYYPVLDTVEQISEKLFYARKP